MYDVHVWAEVHRLHHVEGLSKAAVAAKLSMSRTTMHRLLAVAEPPEYRRRPSGSQVDQFAEAIADRATCAVLESLMRRFSTLTSATCFIASGPEPGQASV